MPEAAGRLRLDAHLERRYRPDPAEPRRLCGPDGRSLLLDPFAAGLVTAAEGRTVSDLVLASEHPREAYALLCVLVAAGALAADPAPPGPPAPRRIPIPDDPPLVSCVIVSHNAEADLPDLVESLRAQTYPALEVIVVDNASADRSRELVRGRFPQVRLLERENLGFFGGFEAGCRASSGRYIACLNADVRLDPQAIAAWVERARARPDAGVVASKMMLASHPRFINSIGNSIAPGTWGFDNFMGVLDMGQFDDLEETFGACFGAALLDRRVIEEVGPLDTGYFLYYEDMDWSYRVRLRGHPVVVAPECVVRHAFGKSVGGRPAEFKMRWVIRNRVRFALQNLGPRMLRAYLPSWVREDAKQAARSALGRAPRRQLGTYAGAYWSLARELPAILAARRRRRGLRTIAAGAELRLRALNFPLPASSHEGEEAKVGLQAARDWYLDLFPLAEAPQPRRRRR